MNGSRGSSGILAHDKKAPRHVPRWSILTQKSRASGELDRVSGSQERKTEVAVKGHHTNCFRAVSDRCHREPETYLRTLYRQSVCVGAHTCVYASPKEKHTPEMLRDSSPPPRAEFQEVTPFTVKKLNCQIPLITVCVPKTRAGMGITVAAQPRVWASVPGNVRFRYTATGRKYVMSCLRRLTQPKSG